MPQRRAGAFTLPLTSGLSNREVKSNFAHLAVLHTAGRHITFGAAQLRDGGAGVLGGYAGAVAPV